MTAAVSRPWYKQPYVWLVAGIPVAAIGFSLSFVYIAVTHQDPVVRDDWYQDGKAINQDLARSDKAMQLGLVADIRLDSTSGEVMLTLTSASHAALPERLHLDLVHATQNTRDQHLVLNRAHDGRYLGQLTRLPEGTFQVELSTRDWRLTGTRRLPDGQGFMLTAQ